MKRLKWLLVMTMMASMAASPLKAESFDVYPPGGHPHFNPCDPCDPCGQAYRASAYQHALRPHVVVATIAVITILAVILINRQDNRHSHH